MGICASCLGRRRHPSQDIDETDPLLDDDQQAAYGGFGGGEASQPDEEELRRQREALERIAAEAADNMVDVLHPSNTEWSHRFDHSISQLSTPRAGSPDNAAKGNVEDEDEEAAWLQSVQAAGAGDIKGLEPGSLVIDISQLRDEPPTTAARTSLKAKLPG